jgi:hypothetical protein
MNRRGPDLPRGGEEARSARRAAAGEWGRALAGSRREFPRKIPQPYFGIVAVEIL